MPQRQAGKRSYAIGCTLERRWFIQFFVSILICLNNGACFCFGVFTPYMKADPFKYNQSEINIISTIGVIASYFSLPTGFLYDAKGPKSTLMVGTALNLVGWLGMMIIFLNPENPLLGTSIWVMSFFYSVSQFSASFYETGSLLTNLDAFLCYQGRVILIQKTFMGLGSSLIVQMYVAFFEIEFETIWPFFLFLVLYSFFVGALGTLFVRLPTEKTQCLGLSIPDKSVVKSGGDESPLFKVPFNIGTGILFTAVFYTLTVTLIENYYQISRTDRHIIGVCTIILCLSFLMMVVFTPSYANNMGGYHVDSMEGSLVSMGGGSDDRAVEDEDERDEGQLVAESDILAGASDYSRNESVVVGPPQEKGNCARECSDGRGMKPLMDEPRSEDVTVIKAKDCEETHTDCEPRSSLHHVEVVANRQGVRLNGDPLSVNLRRCEMWLMWCACFASWSSATLVSTNSSQIYKSLDFDGYSSTVNVAYVSIYGVASAIGRVIVGLSHPLLVRRKIPVSIFFCVAPVLNFIGLPLFLFISSGALFLPFFVVGLATGVSWGSAILIIKSLFVPRSCGKHYSVLYTAGIVSPLLFNVALFGPIYDHYSKVQGRWETRECMGVVCIWISIVVCTIVNIIALPLAVFFFLRIKRRKGFRY